MNKQASENILEEFYTLANDALEAAKAVADFDESSPGLDDLKEFIRLAERQELTAMRLADFCWSNRQAMMDQFQEAVRVVRAATKEETGNADPS